MPTPSSLLYETPCRLQALLADYIACNEEPLQSTKESNVRSHHIGSYSFLDISPGVFRKQAFWVDYFRQHQGVSCTLPG